MIQKIQNNKGSSHIIRVWSYMFLICFISFMIDVISLCTVSVVTSYEAAYYAEKLSIQGGAIGDKKLYPSIAETQNPNTSNACFRYQAPCNGCLTNGDISNKITKTMGYFNVTPQEWSAKIVSDKAGTTNIHASGASTSYRKVYDYMDTVTFVLTTRWQPRILRWLWPQGDMNIVREVPMIIEYIPGINPNDAICRNSWNSGST